MELSEERLESSTFNPQEASATDPKEKKMRHEDPNYYPDFIVELQAGIASQSEEKTSIPSHFQTKRSGSRVTVTNTLTDKQVTVSLCDYAGLRLALNTFCESFERSMGDGTP